MGSTTKEIGGGPAVGLANDWVHALQGLLNTGGMGSAGSPDAYGSAGGVYNVLKDILSGGAGKIGGAYQDIIAKDMNRQALALRGRFTQGGGASFGTPAAYAEALLRSESGPKLIAAIGGLQENAINSLIGSYTGLSGKGISDRQIVQEPSAFSQVLGTVAPVLSAAMPFLKPAFGAGGISSAPGYTAQMGQDMMTPYIPPPVSVPTYTGR